MKARLLKSKSITLVSIGFSILMSMAVFTSFVGVKKELHASSEVDYIEELDNSDSVERYYEYYKDCLLDIEKINKKSKKIITRSLDKCNRMDQVASQIKASKNNDLKLEEEKINSLYERLHSVLSENMNPYDRDKLNLMLVKVLNIRLLLKNDSKDLSEIKEVLNTLVDSNDVFIKEEAMFLRATLYDRSIETKDRALFYFKLLADKPFYTKYGIASSVLVGDYYYNKAKYLQAYPYYKKAYENLSGLDFNGNGKSNQSYKTARVIKTKNDDSLKKEDFKFKILYRISWSAFLGSRNDIAYDYVIELLNVYKKFYESGKDTVWSFRYKEVQDDVVSIMTDILYENKDKYRDLYYKQSNNLLKDQVFLSLTKKFHDNSVYKECVRVGNKYIDNNSKLYVQQLLTVAKCYDKLDNKSGFIQTHEKISTLYLGSFFSEKYSNDSSYLQNIESIGKDSSLKVASFYYDRQEESSKIATKASFIYEGLIKKNPSSYEVVLWYTKLLHLYYTLNLYHKVVDQAQKLYEKYKLSSVQYDNICFIDIKARLKLIDRYSPDLNDLKDIDYLYSSMNDSSTDSYLRLTMFIGSDLYQIGMYDPSISYYKRVLLLSQAKPVDKTIAIRSMVNSLTKLKDDERTVKEIHGFLNFQPIDELDSNLKGELLVQLEESLLLVASRYYENADFEYGYNLLVDDLNKYKFKNNTRLCNLALELGSVSGRFNDEKLKVCKNNKMYSYYMGVYQEKALNFNEAGINFYNFVVANPKDAYTDSALDKAYKISELENDSNLKAQVIEFKARRARENKDYAKYKELSLLACNLYLEARNYQKALDLSNKILKDKNLSKVQQSDFKLITAKVDIAQHKEDKAFSTLAQINKDLDKTKGKNGVSGTGDLEDNRCTGPETKYLMIQDYGKRIENLPSDNDTGILDQKIKLYTNAVALLKKMEDSSLQGSCRKILNDSLVSIQNSSSCILKQIESLKDSSAYNKYIDTAYRLRSDSNYFHSLREDSKEDSGLVKEKLFDNL